MRMAEPALTRSLGPAFLFVFNPTSPRRQAAERNPRTRHRYRMRLWRIGGYRPAKRTAAIVTGVHDPRIPAAALSLSLTGALMILFGVPHGPSRGPTRF